MKNKRIYVDQHKDKSLTIKLCIGQYLEATFSIDELEKILVEKLYGKNVTSMREYSDDEIYGGENDWWNVQFAVYHRGFNTMYVIYILMYYLLCVDKER